MKNIFKAVLILVLTCSLQPGVFAEEYLLKSEYEKAYTEFNKNLKENETAQNYFNMCKVTYYLKDNKLAKAYCNDALNKIDEQEIPDLALRASILSMMGNIYSNYYRNKDITLEYYKQAKEIQDNIGQTDNYELAKLYANLGFAYYNCGLYDYSKEAYEKAVELSVESDKKYNVIKASVYSDLALINRRNQDYKQSKEYLEKGIHELETANEYTNHKLLSVLYLNLAKYYETTKKDKNKAITYYKKSAIENEKFPDSNFFIVSSKNYDNLTIEECKRKLEKYPYDIDTNIDLGYLYTGFDEKLAEKYFSNAININPEKAYTYLTIAMAYADKYNKTNNKLYLININNYSSLAEKNAHYIPEIYLGLGITNMYTEALKKADKYFKKYIEYSNNKSEANCDIASLYWFYDDSEKYRKNVISYLENAIKADENIDNMHKTMLISAYRQIGNTKKADILSKKYFYKK